MAFTGVTESDAGIHHHLNQRDQSVGGGPQRNAEDVPPKGATSAARAEKGGVTGYGPSSRNEGLPVLASSYLCATTFGVNAEDFTVFVFFASPPLPFRRPERGPLLTFDIFI